MTTTSMKSQSNESFEDSMQSLYSQHLNALTQRYLAAAKMVGKEAVIISSGSLKTAFLDDFTYPFQVNPHFKNFVPITDVPDSFVVIQQGKKPQLLFHQPADYWHKAPETPTGYWVDDWDITSIAQPMDAHNHLGNTEHFVFIGEEAELAQQFSISTVNDAQVLNHIHFDRAYKSDFEIECLRAASGLAAKGHRAAHQAFLAGDSEFQIQQAYLAATQHREKQTPYSNIVALNEHCAILHYQFYEHERFEDSSRHSMLIDAGASFQGYASDVTRTYSSRAGVFANLIEAMDEAQLGIIADIQVGMEYSDLHSKMHLRLAQILRDFSIVNMSIESMLETNLTFNFLPHGLGHFLGLQTHDVGGFQQDKTGLLKAAPDKYPALRLTRKIENRQVFTIEPGLYFIPMLLRELKASEHSASVNWDLLETLMPYGGIRIEDNIAVINDQPINLTREAMDQL